MISTSESYLLNDAGPENETPVLVIAFAASVFVLASLSFGAVYLFVTNFRYVALLKKALPKMEAKLRKSEQIARDGAKLIENAEATSALEEENISVEGPKGKAGKGKDGQACFTGIEVSHPQALVLNPAESRPDLLSDFLGGSEIHLELPDHPYYLSILCSLQKPLDQNFCAV